jgi:hypothetical protein
MLDPEMIILGGSVIKNYDIIQPILMKSLNDNCFNALMDGVKIVLAELGNHV